MVKTEIKNNKVISESFDEITENDIHNIFMIATERTMDREYTILYNDKLKYDEKILICTYNRTNNVVVTFEIDTSHIFDIDVDKFEIYRRSKCTKIKDIIDRLNINISRNIVVDEYIIGLDSNTTGSSYYYTIYNQNTLSSALLNSFDFAIRYSPYYVLLLNSLLVYYEELLGGMSSLDHNAYLLAFKYYSEYCIRSMSSAFTFREKSTMVIPNMLRSK